MKQEQQPLWMPAGSVRSLVALAITGAFIFGMVPVEVATLVLGYYFATKIKQD